MKKNDSYCKSILIRWLLAIAMEVRTSMPLGSSVYAELGSQHPSRPTGCGRPASQLVTSCTFNNKTSKLPRKLDIQFFSTNLCLIPRRLSIAYRIWPHLISLQITEAICISKISCVPSLLCMLHWLRKRCRVAPPIAKNTQQLQFSCSRKTNWNRRTHLVHTVGLEAKNRTWNFDEWGI